MKTIPRFPPRIKRDDGTYGCRGCGGDIPPKRQTWCSLSCKKKFDPFYVKQAVRERCGDRCETCAKDCSRKAGHAHQQRHPAQPHYERDCKLVYPYDFQAFLNHPLYRAYSEAVKEWKRAAPNAEFDHIIPHSEGGKFVLENIRLLCTACHKARTKAWHAERKLKRQLTTK